MTLAITTLGKTPRNAATCDQLAGGTIEFYSGTRPALGTTLGIALQAVVDLGTPAFLSVDGVGTLIGPIEGVRTDAAAITWCRFKTTVGEIVMDGDVSSTAEDTGDVKLTNVNGTVGGFVQVTSGTLRG